MWRTSKEPGDDVALHAHDEAQLIFAASGTMQVHTATGRWLVPPHLAVWAPGGVPHRLEILSRTELWMIYWHPNAAAEWAPSDSLRREFALKVTPLLRTLIFAAFEAGASRTKAELVARLILHELVEAPDAPTFLPLPTSLIGRRIASQVLADPKMVLDVDMLASRAATSVRTLSRLFPTETGLTFRRWRQRARIVAAVEKLSSGDTVADVAAGAGFASTAAFCFAFRQVIGVTPMTFQKHQQSGGISRRADGAALPTRAA